MSLRLLIVFCATCLATSLAAQSLQLTGLQCEYRENPSGVIDPKPALSWKIVSKNFNVLQSAYRVLVADDSLQLKSNRGNIWDSRRVNSNQSLNVRFAGKPLQSAKNYYWKVQVWDNKGRVSDWSEIASWQMGLLTTSDWSGARWIAYEEIHDSAVIAPHVHQGGKKSWGARKNILPQFRKEFTLTRPIRSATIFISGLGHFELTVNGKPASDHFLSPGWTNYSQHAQYVTLDVTQLLQQGRNALGVMLGNGFYYIPSQRYRKMTGAYGLPKVIAKLLINYGDGGKDEIITDETWKTSPSPVIFSSIYGGEDYDAGLYQEGWDQPGFNDQTWRKPVFTSGPKLEPQQELPVKMMDAFNGDNRRSLSPGVEMFDLGQNFSGVPAITVQGSRGDTVRLYAAELVHPDGRANQKATGSPSYFTYILRGGAAESWQPRFSYTGFRYVEVRCIPRDSGGIPPEVLQLEGRHMRNAAPGVGKFESSNELFNRTHHLIDWAIRSNMMSVFTDCPHREKLGWLEQTHLMGASVHYRYDVAALNRKIFGDLKYAQYPDGKIPEIAPEFTKFPPPFDESPEWGSAAVILPWYQYLWYGDIASLRSSYPVMKKYIDYLATKADGYILSHGLGDWYDIGPKKSGFSQMTSIGITATSMFYYDLGIMQQVAKVSGNPADATRYRELAAKVKTAFNNRFFDKRNMRYDSASQTANAMALYMKLVPEPYRATVLSALISDIRSRNNALTAGDIGYRYVIKALEEAGRQDVIFDMNSRDDVPGYGYQLKQGATALTESWRADLTVSNNHFMLGHLMEWFYYSLAGIRQAEGSVGYRIIEIRPAVLDSIRSASATFESPYGTIASSWKKEGSQFILNVTIPANTTARLVIPMGSKQSAWLNGRRVQVKSEKNIGFITVGSGSYQCLVK